MRILVVDDDPSVRGLLTLQLELAGYDVDSVADGQSALDATTALRPDLVVLDLMMPRLSGWEVLERLRAGPDTRSTPVVVLSARDLPDDRHRARELGASSVLSKPHDEDVLLSTVAALLTTVVRST